VAAGYAAAMGEGHEKTQSARRVLARCGDLPTSTEDAEALADGRATVETKRSEQASSDNAANARA